MSKDLFVIHPSVFHDAFRTDYDTSFRQSSREFLNLLFRHNKKTGCKIAVTSGEVFNHLRSKLENVKIFWVIPNNIVEIDFKTTFDKNLKKDQSIIQLASRKCIKFSPFIVSTKPKNSIDLEGTSFPVITPKEAVEMYNSPNGRFNWSNKEE